MILSSIDVSFLIFINLFCADQKEIDELKKRVEALSGVQPVSQTIVQGDNLDMN